MTISVPSLMMKFTYAIENYGVGFVMEKLDEMNRQCENNHEKKLENFIIAECCKQYGVDVDDVKTNNTIKGEALTARNMCFVQIKKHLDGYSYLQIAKALKKNSPNSVQRTLDEYIKMSPKIKHEREFLELFDILNARIKVYKNQTLVH